MINILLFDYIDHFWAWITINIGLFTTNKKYYIYVGFILKPSISVRGQTEI